MTSNPKPPGVLTALVLFLLPLFLPAQTNPVPYRKGTHWGYANPETGQILLAPTLDSVGFFSNYEGGLPLAWVKKGQRFGLVNLSGELVLPIQETSPLTISRVAAGFFAVERFAYGVSSNEEELRAGVARSRLLLPHPVSYFDRNGRLIGRPFEHMAFHNPYYVEENSPQDINNFQGVAYPQMHNDGLYPTIWSAGRIGLFDLQKGKVVVQPVWDAITIRSGLAFVQRWTLENPTDGNMIKTVLINLQNGLKTELPDSIAAVNTYGQGELVLAWNKRTKLYGFLNRSGRVVIPFQFLQANAFSANGLTKVLATNELWSVIDLQGREQYGIGKYNGVRYLPDGSLWTQSDEDRLYRKRNFYSEDTCGIGLEEPPQLVKIGKSSYLIGRKDGKTGLLNTDGGGILLPFDLDYYYPAYNANSLPQDSVVHNRLFIAGKNGRAWIFDGEDRQPLRPKVLPGNGLTLGESFDKSNFDLLPPVSGDSLFRIKLADKSMDILNIKTGKRWNVSNAAYFEITTDRYTDTPVIDYSPVNRDLPVQHFHLNGQPALERIALDSTAGFGRWSMGWDRVADSTTLFDSTGRVICRFRDPFGDNNNRPRIESNWHSTRMPFVILARSSDQCAVFSLDGRLLTPPGISSAWITDDFIFATKDGKSGVCALPAGRVVVPFVYEHTYPGGDHLSAIDSAGTERQFDLEGNLLRTYPTGYTSVNYFTDGFQVVQHKGKTAFIDEHLTLSFDQDSILQVRAFSERLAAVQIAKSGWKYIRPSAQTAFPGYFEYAEPFQNGRAIVRTTDGWTKAIDSLGHILLQVPSNADSNVPVLALLGKNLLLKKDPGNTQVITPDGQPILQHCVCASNFLSVNYSVPLDSDTIPFSCDGRLGRLLPDGRIEDVKKSDFVLDHDPRRGTRSVLLRYGCSAEGLLDPATGEWIIPPKAHQEIVLPADQPTIAYVSDFLMGTTTLNNRKTGAVIPIIGSIVQKLEDGLGWLVLDNKTKTGFLYSPDFMSVKPWNYAYKTIQRDDFTGLLQVLNDRQQSVGYISKNGHILFED